MNESAASADMPGQSIGVIRPAHNMRPRLKKARKHVDRLTRRVQKALQGGNLRKARFLSMKISRSHDAKVCALWQAARNMHRRGEHELSPNEVLVRAREVSAIAAPQDEIRVHAKPKDRWPEFRPIFSFGLIDTARQRLIKSAIEPLLSIDPRQYGTQNGGRPEIVRRVLQTIGSRQYKYVATCDIKSFYPTVSRDWLRQSLPTGEEVITSTILVEDSHHRTRYTGHGLNKVCVSDFPLAVASQRGLPQGACSSPMIADYIVGQALSGINLPEGVVLKNYADNFVVMGRRRADVEQAVHSLGDVFERHPAGPFQLTDNGIRRIADGFEFLGYRFRRRKGRDLAVPTPKNISKLYERLKHHIDGLRRGGDPRKLRASLKCWANAFSAAPRAEAEVWQLLLDLLRMPEIRPLWPAFELALAPFIKAMRARLPQHLLHQTPAE